MPLHRRRNCWALAAAVAAAVFCAVNIPLFITPHVFVHGLSSEVAHALDGHIIVLYGWQSKFVFTWNANIWPGLDAPLALAGLLGAFVVAVRWRVSPPVLRHLLVFGLTWYLMHELSPMKPFPEGARHMTVMPAVFAVFAVFAVEYVANWLPAPFRAVVTATTIGGIAVIPAAASYELTQSATNDTGLVVERLADSLDGPIVWVGFPSQPWFDLSQPIEESARFLVMNELWAKQSVYSLSLQHQDERRRRVGSAYEALLTRPALIVASSAGSFAFRNVPYRIVALKGDPRELTTAAMRFAVIPSIHLQLIAERQNVVQNSH